MSAQGIREIDILVEVSDLLDPMIPGAVPDQVVEVEAEWITRELAYSLTKLEPETRRVINEPRDPEVVLTVVPDQSCVAIIRVVVIIDLLSEYPVGP